NDIGIIRSASGYSSGDSTQANPTIASNGYFYCVNNLRLFNAEFGTGSVSPWGRNPGQTVPAWEIPSDSWGVQYKIRKVGTDTTAGKWEWVRIYTSNERFRRDQFVGEIVEFCDTIHSPQRARSANGSRYKVYANGPNWFELRQYTLAWEAGRFDPQNRDGCDTLMIVGMPAKGGVVSMTLKNQYNQITSRTVDYAFLNDEIRNWFGRSVEKVDPTHYTWVVRRRPSFGGKPADARNSSTRNIGVQANVKNGPYNSVTEVQYVRKGEDFENVGAGSKSGSGARTMASLASFFGNSHIRLEAMDADVTGWKIAYDSVANAIRNGVNAGRGGWEDDQWKGQRIRFMTGPLRGETFPVTGNSRNTVSIYDPISAGAPRSTPSGVSFRPNDDDLFTLGPGYTTPFSYTRRSNDEGVFTWRGCVQAPASYELYLFGLNDAINTTEFLEENNNSPLDVSVWNYVAQRFDPLCSREKYDKDDCIHAGTVKPEHISPQGDVKMRLVSHDVVEDDAPGQSKDGRVMTRSVRRRSGYAWFNYALLTPAPVIGRVNVNTASARLLRSLPGVTDTLAANIAAGVDSHGVPSLKPYRRLGDLLSVRGMSVAALERMANLVMLQSDAYTIAVEAQAVRDVNRNGAFDDASDAVTAERRMRYIVRMRHGGPELPPVQLLEKTRL
ncbi:helix-hairpin-helix domain-containing protein, partial [bacterium]|nr:helix-hairpin-helix domain-containing protein [bacterium]